MSMFRKSILRKGAIAALLTCSALLAQASIVVYQTQAEFEAAVANLAVESFDLLNIDGSDQLTRAAGPYSYTATAAGGFYAVGSGPDGWLSTNIALPITFDAFSGGVSAIGGTFFATDLDGNELGGEALTLTVVDASGAITRTLTDPTVSSFLGFVSTDSIVSLQVGVVDTGFNNAWVTVNDLNLAGPVAAVPEPDSLALLIIGLACAATATARSRRKG